MRAQAPDFPQASPSDPIAENETNSTQPPASEAASAILTIDLTALAANYRALREAAPAAECGAVVKADAYGLGMAKVAPALWRAGCHTFFVATLDEGEALRALLPKAIIYVFNGLLPGAAPLFAKAHLRPVLNSRTEIAEWAGFCCDQATKYPAAIHVDTGMNRLGLTAADLNTLVIPQNASLLENFTLALVMSHLACADTPDHPKNKAQLDAFKAARAHLPDVPASLANSAGVLLGPDYHFGLVRPGIALYGGQPAEHPWAALSTVVTLQGRVLQIREAEAGETVGYGATRTLKAPARLATIATGYADGLSWRLGAGDGVERLNAYFGSYPAPILGRISMDLISVDVSDVPDAIAHRGAFAELIGPQASLAAIASHAGTVNYEVLTNLCRRAERRYCGD